MRLLASAGKGLLVLAPMVAEGRFPVGVGLDAVAVADVDGGGAGEPLGGAFEGGDAPVLDLAHVDVEGRLVELHHVDAERRELVRLLVQRCGEGVGERRGGRGNARRRWCRRWSSDRAG